MKKMIARVLDVVLICMLVSPWPHAQTFAFTFVCLMIPLMLIGVFGMNDKLADEHVNRSAWRHAYSFISSGVFVLALIYSGSPITAAMYAMVRIALHASAIAHIEKRKVET